MMQDALFYCLELYEGIALLSVKPDLTFEEVSLMNVQLEELRETILYLINLERNYE